MATSAVTSTEPKSSVWEDFLDIFYAPSDVFERRRDGRFGLALLILVLLAAVLGYASSIVLEPAYRGEIVASMARRAANGGQELTPEQMQGALKFGAIMGQVGAVIMIPILVFLSGLVLWLVGKLFDSQMTVKQGFMVATYANFPRILQWLFMIIQGLVMDVSGMNRMYMVSPSAARFAGPDTSEMVRALLMRIDPFIIWITILMGIGLAITGRISKGKGIAAAFVVFVLATLPALLGAR